MNLVSLTTVVLLALGTTWSPQDPAHASPTEPVGPPPAAEEPFPLKTTTLKTDGSSYYVEGRVRIPRNQTIVSLRQMNLTGRGPQAVLEVSGKLEIKAATGGRNKIRNLTIEVMPDCKDLLVTEATFSGGGGIRTSPDGPADTEIYLQNLQLLDSATLSLKMHGGQIDLQDSAISTPVRIQGIDRSEKNRSKLKVIILNNKPAPVGAAGGPVGNSNAGFAAGLLLDNAWDALVRNNDLSGSRTAIEHCRKLDFDGNNVRSQLFELIQNSPKDYKKTKIQNCDFHSPTVRIFAPGDPRKPEKLERMIIHGSWFHGSTDPKEIREKYIQDGGREKGNGMMIQFKKTSPRLRGLGGTAGG